VSDREVRRALRDGGSPRRRPGLGLPEAHGVLDAFEPASDVIGIGVFEDPITNGSMAIFASLDFAQRFVA
jgi:hypothetical protein